MGDQGCPQGHGAASDQIVQGADRFAGSFKLSAQGGGSSGFIATEWYNTKGGFQGSQLLAPKSGVR